MEIEQAAIAAPEPVADTTPEASSIDAAFDSVFGEDEDDAGPVTLAEPKAEEKPAPAAPVKGPLAEPPSRFSPDAKAAWEQAPEPVKGEIKRAITELETGLAEKNAVIEPLKPFFDLAKQHGVTVHDTMDKYVRMEQLLFKDPAKGLEAIANNMGMTLPEMLAFVQGAPGAKSATPPDAAFVAVKRELDEMKRQFGEINQHVKAQNESQLLSQIDAFAADKPRFEELSGEIVRLIETGYAKDLAHAYEIAERLIPAPAAAQAAPPPAAQTRKPPRSVVGAPASGPNPRTGVKLSDSENLDAILDQVGIR